MTTNDIDASLLAVLCPEERDAQPAPGDWAQPDDLPKPPDCHAIETPSGR